MLRRRLTQRLATGKGAQSAALFRRMYAGYDRDAGVWRETKWGAAVVEAVLDEQARGAKKDVKMAAVLAE